MSASLVLGLVLACTQPHPDPKTGDVVSESGHEGCMPPGGPKADVPVAPTPTPEPEKPTVVAKPSEAPHREQPSPADKPKLDKPADKNAEAVNDKSDKSDKSDKPSVTAKESGTGKVKNFDFSGLSLNGSNRSPQLLYFLERANEELERASLEKRSFILHMVKSVEEESL